MMEWFSEIQICSQHSFGLMPPCSQWEPHSKALTALPNSFGKDHAIAVRQISMRISQTFSWRVRLEWNGRSHKSRGALFIFKIDAARMGQLLTKTWHSFTIDPSGGPPSRQSIFRSRIPPPKHAISFKKDLTAKSASQKLEESSERGGRPIHLDRWEPRQALKI